MSLFLSFQVSRQTAQVTLKNAQHVYFGPPSQPLDLQPVHHRENLLGERFHVYTLANLPRLLQ